MMNGHVGAESETVVLSGLDVLDGWMGGGNVMFITSRTAVDRC